MVGPPPSLLNLFVLFFISSPLPLSTFRAHAWGQDGHYIICSIAQSHLKSDTLKIVQSLLPRYSGGRLANLCWWANEIRFLEQWHWTIPLHFIETPDYLCNYDYTRDCQSPIGEDHMCSAGAINNYTTQLANYGSSKNQYNLTEALLFLAHFLGDIHQKTTDVFLAAIASGVFKRFTGKLHQITMVWDDGILNGLKNQHYSNSNILELIKDIEENITGYWKEDIPEWTVCPDTKIACPDKYAKESIKLACWWAYKGVVKGSNLEYNYYLSRLAIVQRRLAQAGIRLASILNHILRDPVL